MFVVGSLRSLIKIDLQFKQYNYLYFFEFQDGDSVNGRKISICVSNQFLN